MRILHVEGLNKKKYGVIQWNPMLISFQLLSRDDSAMYASSQLATHSPLTDCESVTEDGSFKPFRFHLQVLMMHCSSFPKYVKGVL